MLKIKEEIIGKRYCPKCESENVRYEEINDEGIKGDWVCKECGFLDLEFPKIDKEEEEEVDTMGEVLEE